MKKSIFVVALFWLINLCACGNVVQNTNNEMTKKVEGISVEELHLENVDLSILNGKKIGITVQSMQNTYWAGIMTALGEILDKNGADYTIVSCDDSATKQISQIENFISSGCDMIMAHPSDSDALESVFAEAMAKGIKTLSWDDIMEHSNTNLTMDNTMHGYAIGKAAAEFINKYYTSENKAEVIVVGYPKTKVLLEREEGIKKGLEEFASGNYEIVASQPGLVAIEAQSAVETILQAHPNAKVVVGVSAGGMIGADEALNIYTNGNIPEDMGVFTADVTKQQIEHLLDKYYPAKVLVGFEGSDEDTGKMAAGLFASLLRSDLEGRTIYRNRTLVDEENAKEFMKGMK